jgi:hypothetical protein
MITYRICCTTVPTRMDCSELSLKIRLVHDLYPSPLHQIHLQCKFCNQAFYMWIRKWHAERWRPCQFQGKGMCFLPKCNRQPIWWKTNDHNMSCSYIWERSSGQHLLYLNPLAIGWFSCQMHQQEQFKIIHTPKFQVIITGFSWENLKGLYLTT